MVLHVWMATLFLLAGSVRVAAFPGTSTGEVRSQVIDTVMLRTVPLVEGLENAHSMVFRPDDELIITESDADRIAAFRVFVDEQEAAEPEDIFLPDLDRPQGLSLQAGINTVIISAGTAQVHLLDESMGYLQSLAVPNWVTGNGSFEPSDVTTNSIGEIYILDTNQKRIYHFNANGSYLQHIMVDEIERPTALVYAEESLFVSDSGSGRVYVLTENGHELATIGTFPDLSRVRVIDRRIWVISGRVIHEFNLYGEHLGNWALEHPGESIQDLAIIDDQLFLLTSGSLYFAGSRN